MGKHATGVRFVRQHDPAVLGWRRRMFLDAVNAQVPEVLRALMEVYGSLAPAELSRRLSDEALGKVRAWSRHFNLDVAWVHECALEQLRVWHRHGLPDGELEWDIVQASENVATPGPNMRSPRLPPPPAWDPYVTPEGAYMAEVAKYVSRVKRAVRQAGGVPERYPDQDPAALRVSDPLGWAARWHVLNESPADIARRWRSRPDKAFAENIRKACVAHAKSLGLPARPRLRAGRRRMAANA